MTDKLKETFNLEGGESEKEDSPATPFDGDEIPDHLTLDDIAHMAAHAYKEQVKDAQNIPTKNRSRAMDVAKGYLDIAKDAVHKRDTNEMKKGTKSINTDRENQDQVEDQSEGGTTSRSRVYEMIDNNEK